MTPGAMAIQTTPDTDDACFVLCGPAIGDDTRAAGDRSAALVVYEMCDFLVLRHLDPRGKKLLQP